MAAAGSRESAAAGGGSEVVEAKSAGPTRSVARATPVARRWARMDRRSLRRAAPSVKATEPSEDASPASGFGPKIVASGSERSCPSRLVVCCSPHSSSSARLRIRGWPLSDTRVDGAVTESDYADLRWRLLGPFRGGWATAVAGIPGDPATFFFGGADGGVWKTTDAGVTWQPLFEHGRASSIGALAIAPERSAR